MQTTQFLQKSDFANEGNWYANDRCSTGGLQTTWLIQKFDFAN
jgi:hypothetical protein